MVIYLNHFGLFFLFVVIMITEGMAVMCVHNNVCVCVCVLCYVEFYVKFFYMSFELFRWVSSVTMLLTMD